MPLRDIKARIGIMDEIIKKLIRVLFLLIAIIGAGYFIVYMVMAFTIVMSGFFLAAIASGVVWLLLKLFYRDVSDTPKKIVPPPSDASGYHWSQLIDPSKKVIPPPTPKAASEKPYYHYTESDSKENDNNPIWITLGIIVVAVFCAYLVQTYSNRTTTNNSESTASYSAPVTQDPSFYGGTFSVNFPSQPTVENKKSVGFATGVDVNYTQYECDEKSSGFVVYVYYVTMPENERKYWYNLLIKYSANTIDAKISSITEHLQNGILCYEAKLVRRDVSCMMRVIYNANRLYVISYLCPEKYFYDNKYSDFINSFKIQKTTSSVQPTPPTTNNYQAKTQTESKPTIKNSKWRSITCRVFSIEFPCQVEKLDNQILPDITYGYMGRDGENVYYASVRDYAGGIPDKDENIKSVINELTQFGGEITVNNKIEINGLSGRSIVVINDNGKHIMRCRVLMDEYHLYQLTVSVTSENPSYDDQQTFFDSFSILHGNS